MSDEIVTIDPDGLAPRAAASDNLFAVVFAPGGQLQKLPFDKLLTKLIAANLAKDTELSLRADLDHAADSVALVFNDPVAAKNGWWRKIGGVGTGDWIQFEVLAKSVRDDAEGFAALSLARANAAAESNNAATFAALQRAFVTIDGRNAYASVSPRSAWNGTVGTGFTSPPVDPTRTTAKPAMRLVVPPRQRFTNHLVVGVLAAANNRGRLDNLGVMAVRCHYEGNVATCLEPSWRSYLDANGQQQSVFAHWFVLVHNGVNSADASNGGAHVYFESIPLDSTMQNRVIGPIEFFPRGTLNDTELTIAPSLAEVPGSRYQTFLAAMNFIRTNNRHFALITATEAGNYDLGQMPAAFATRGHTIIRATAPITIAKSSYTTDTAAVLRARLDPLWFQGSNITIDFQNIEEVYNDASITLPNGNYEHVLEGIRVTNSATLESLRRKGVPRVAARFRGRAYFLGCQIDNVLNPCLNASLVLCCTVSQIGADVFSDALCVIHTRCDDVDSSWFQLERPAMSVTYTGAGTNWGLQTSGNSDADSRTFTARVDGAVVGTFTVGATEALFATGTNYDVADVVGWINGLGAGWSATLIDDTRRASALSIAGAKGAAFNQTLAIGATLSVVSMFDLHGDWFQQQGNIQENVICNGNLSTNMVTQDIITTGISGAGARCRDSVFINNAWHHKTTDRYNTGYGLAANIQSQLQRQHSHVVIAHNSWSGQSMALRGDIGGGAAYAADTYCLIANNALRGLAWQGTTNTNVSIQDNHLEAGATNPTNGTGTSIGGTPATFYVRASEGDFSPAGELLTNTKPSKLRLPLRGPVRSPLAPAGAVA